MFQIEPLPYEYGALDPFIDAKTVEIHYLKHHQNYCNNLNKVLEGYEAFQQSSLEDLLKNVDGIPGEIRQTVINNAGGLYNHNFYWKCLNPKPIKNPQGALAQEIQATFGSFEMFKKLFTESSTKFFGSGWMWLVKDSAGKLAIVPTVNQECPISKGHTPIIALDLWEHAYYLKYQNRRSEYIDAWWNLVTWS